MEKNPGKKNEIKKIPTDERRQLLPYFISHKNWLDWNKWSVLERPWEKKTRGIFKNKAQDKKTVIEYVKNFPKFYFYFICAFLITLFINSVFVHAKFKFLVVFDKKKSGWLVGKTMDDSQ